MPRYPHGPNLPDLPYSPPAPQQEIPVFNLEVLLSELPGHEGYQARIANLMIAQSTGRTARDAIADIIPKAKQLIANCMARDQPIPWISPSDVSLENETRMLVPIHL